MANKQNASCNRPPTRGSPHGKQKETQRSECSVETIPDYVFESLARCALPIIQAYYESEEGRKAYEEWKAMREQSL